MRLSYGRLAVTITVIVAAFLFLAWYVAGRDRLGPALERAAETGEWGLLAIEWYRSHDPQFGVADSVTVTGSGIVCAASKQEPGDAPWHRTYERIPRDSLRELLGLLARNGFSEMDERPGGSAFPDSSYTSVTVHMAGSTHRVDFPDRNEQRIAMPPELGHITSALGRLWEQTMGEDARPLAAP